MDVEDFWRFLERSGDEETDLLRRSAWLECRLSRVAPNHIVDFQIHLDNARRSIDTWDMLGAANLIMDGLTLAPRPLRTGLQAGRLADPRGQVRVLPSGPTFDHPGRGLERLPGMESDDARPPHRLGNEAHQRQPRVRDAGPRGGGVTLVASGHDLTPAASSASRAAVLSLWVASSMTHVAVKVRYRCYFTPIRSMKLRGGPTTDPDIIAGAAATALAKIDLNRPVRLLGVRADLEPPAAVPGTAD